MKNTILTKSPENETYTGLISLATQNDLTCARDHKWRLIQDTINREMCNCDLQRERFSMVLDLWQCQQDYLQDQGNQQENHGLCVRSAMSKWDIEYTESGILSPYFPFTHRGRISIHSKTRSLQNNVVCRVWRCMETRG